MPPPVAPSAGHASWSPVVVDRTERPSSTDGADSMATLAADEFVPAAFSAEAPAEPPTASPVEGEMADESNDGVQGGGAVAKAGGKGIGVTEGDRPAPAHDGQVSRSAAVGEPSAGETPERSASASASGCDDSGNGSPSANDQHVRLLACLLAAAASSATSTSTADEGEITTPAVSDAELRPGCVGAAPGKEPGGTNRTPESAAGGVVENQLGAAGQSVNSARSAERRAAADDYEAEVDMFAAERADGWHSVRRRGRKEKRPQQQKKEEEEIIPGNEAAMGSDEAKTEGDVIVKTNGGGREKMLAVGDCS